MLWPLEIDDSCAIITVWDRIPISAPLFATARTPGTEVAT